MNMFSIFLSSFRKVSVSVVFSLLDISSAKSSGGVTVSFIFHEFGAFVVRLCRRFWSLLFIMPSLLEFLF